MVRSGHSHRDDAGIERDRYPGMAEWRTEVLLARRDETGQLRQIGLALPLAPGLWAQVGERAHVDPRRVADVGGPVPEGTSG